MLKKGRSMKMCNTHAAAKLDTCNRRAIQDTLQRKPSPINERSRCIIALWLK